ncbi:hypothetical protein SBRCBS47491_007521 [Sporothrix bragantina]|uniref:Zn(2)-C6 fungal-type domain-containing protein n=1 Tax=Sporothrix bragantina TaxID=671064 RepID=A0ABP0CDU3_9PEZI
MDMPVARSSWDPALDFLERRSSYPGHDHHRHHHSSHHHHTHALHQTQSHPQTLSQSSPQHEHHQHHHSHPDASPPQTQSRMRRGSGEPAKQLACSSCRKKKIKCQPNVDGGRCRACLRSGAECLIPAVDERKLSNSKKLVRELYAKIASLEAELQSHREGGRVPQTLVPTREPRRDSFHHIIGVIDDDDRSTKTPPDAGDEVMVGAAVSPSSNQSDLSGRSGSGASDNMIIRLCGGYRQLNSDRVGRLRYFGPTSSLHLAESVTSSILLREPAATHTGGVQWQDAVSSALQDHLFELYWKYQHQVIPIVHKEAFLQDFKSGQTKYCSKLLVHCILARAAAISDRPDIRAMALVEDEVNEDPPLLVRRCADLLDAELNQPGITTLQSLELLSEIYCVVSNDTKGWMDAGGASRLAFELGLHSDMDGFSGTTTTLSPVEQEVRQICFWSCFSFDRQWALYLGRPQMIKLDDVSVRKPNTKPSTHETSLELRMSAAWADLLEIVGILCDALNGAQTKRHRVAALDRSFRDWYTNLDAEFRYNPQQIPAVFHLHMQYSAAVILLHRPLAQFGNVTDEPPESRYEYDQYGQRSQPRPSPKETSRQICVQHACLIAQYLQQYEDCHGSLRTLSWVTLHMIGTAATTLIATLSERSDGSNTTYLVSSLQTCIRSLGALEESHLPTRRVRKLILHAMRLLNLESKLNTVISSSSSAASTSTASSAPSAPIVAPIHTSTGSWAPASLDMPIGGIWGGEAHSSVHAESAAFDEFLPPGNYGSQAEMLMSFESLLY